MIDTFVRQLNSLNSQRSTLQRERVISSLDMNQAFIDAYFQLKSDIREVELKMEDFFKYDQEVQKFLFR